MPEERTRSALGRRHVQWNCVAKKSSQPSRANNAGADSAIAGNRLHRGSRASGGRGLQVKMEITELISLPADSPLEIGWNLEAGGGQQVLVGLGTGRSLNGA